MDEERRGVYLLQEDSIQEVEVNKVITCDVWHKRLGHPPKIVMSLFTGKL